MQIFKKSKGFTLVELLVVIAIIGILSSVVLASVGSARAKARDGRRISDMKALQAAVELYKSRELSGRAPTEAEGLADLVTKGFIAAVPTDPKNATAYEYKNSGDSNNETFSLKFTTESPSNLGAEGLYCATSTTMEAASGGSCTER